MATRKTAPKPTYSSVTAKPCKCGYLQRGADDPDLPIVFDPRLNEYNFEYQEACATSAGCKGKGTLRIYHCPFCGGAAPKSKRRLLFAVISASEQKRLTKVLAGIKTLNDALKVLGPADRDQPDGVTRRWPERKAEAPKVESFRTLTYTQLSKVADVFITDFRDGNVHFRLQGKYVGFPAKDRVGTSTSRRRPAKGRL